MPIQPLSNLLRTIATRIEADKQQAWGLLDCLFTELHDNEPPKPEMDIILVNLTIAAIRKLLENLPPEYWPSNTVKPEDQINNSDAFTLLASFDNNPNVPHIVKTRVAFNAARQASSGTGAHRPQLSDRPQLIP